MKIVGYLHYCPPLRVVGGEMMTLRLLDHSAAQGHDVSAVIRELDHPRMFGKVRLIPGHTSEQQVAIHEFNEADLIVTHPEIAEGPYRYSTRYMKTPTVGIVHNLGKRTLRGMRQRLEMGIVANSHNTARLLIESEVTGTRPITVVYPPTEPPVIPGNHVFPKVYCTMVNLSQAKGAKTLHRLVKALPEVPFLTVLGGHGEQEVPRNDHGNVTLYGHFSGLGLPYAMTRVLLAPSLDETYGMVVTEATALGIPVVASDIPAHREALGDSATYVELDDPAGWITAVQTLMMDEEAWSVAHQRAVDYGSELREREAMSFLKWDQLIDYLAVVPEAL